MAKQYSAPFWELCANEVQLEPQTQRERVAHAIRLGYDGVAIAYQAGGRLADKDGCSIKPVDLPELLTATRGVQEALRQAAARRGQGAHGNAYAFRQLTRINIPIDDAGIAQASCSSAAAGSYDLLAVQPLTERAFALACTSLDVDVISTDLSKRLPFRFKPALVKSALARGVHFEICFSPALRDSNARRQLFANAQALCRETRGHNIIVASAARSAMELRGVYDVINLATLLGLTEAQAKSAVSKNAQRVVDRAMRRKAHRGAVLIRVKTAEEMAAKAEEQQAQEEARRQQPAAETSESQPLSFAKSRLTPQKRK